MTDKQIFDQVIQLPVCERAELVASEYKDQPELRTRIEALIAAHQLEGTSIGRDKQVCWGDWCPFGKLLCRRTVSYGPGGYRFCDYLRIGAPLNLLLGAVATLLIPWCWPF